MNKNKMNKKELKQWIENIYVNGKILVSVPNGYQLGDVQCDVWTEEDEKRWMYEDYENAYSNDTPNDYWFRRYGYDAFGKNDTTYTKDEALEYLETLEE